MRNWLFLIVVLLFVFSGCGDKEKPQFTEEEMAQIPFPQRDGLPQASGGFVLSVGNDTLDYGQIVGPIKDRLAEAAKQSNFEEFRVKAGPSIKAVVVNKIADILLYQKAKKEAGEDIDKRLDKVVEAETRKFLISFGGDYAKAEEYLANQMGMDWREFKNYQKRIILSSSYLHQKADEPKPVTYSDIVEYYSKWKDEYYYIPKTFTIRLIDLETKKIELDDPSQSRPEAARKLAEFLMDKINKGEDFGELAKQYSHGYRASKGGLWNPVGPRSLAEPYDILATKAEKMQPGQIAGPFEKSGHIFIIKLEEKQEEDFRTFEEVQQEIEHIITMEREQQVFNEIIQKFVESTQVAGIEKFVDFCIEQIYLEANQ